MIEEMCGSLVSKVIGYEHDYRGSIPGRYRNLFLQHRLEPIELLMKWIPRSLFSGGKTVGA
jgi:hypothetical protein